MKITIKRYNILQFYTYYIYVGIKLWKTMSVQPVTNRFADYFVISGLDVKSGLEPDQLSG